MTFDFWFQGAPVLTFPDTQEFDFWFQGSPVLYFSDLVEIARRYPMLVEWQDTIFLVSRLYAFPVESLASVEGHPSFPVESLTGNRLDFKIPVEWQDSFIRLFRGYHFPVESLAEIPHSRTKFLVEILLGTGKREVLLLEWDGRDPFSFPQDWNVLRLQAAILVLLWDAFASIHGSEVHHQWRIVETIFNGTLLHSWRVLPLIPATFSEDVHRPVSVVTVE